MWNLIERLLICLCMTPWFSNLARDAQTEPSVLQANSKRLKPLTAFVRFSKYSLTKSFRLIMALRLCLRTMNLHESVLKTSISSSTCLSFLTRRRACLSPSKVLMKPSSAPSVSINLISNFFLVFLCCTMLRLHAKPSSRSLTYSYWSALSAKP